MWDLDLQATCLDLLGSRGIAKLLIILGARGEHLNGRGKSQLQPIRIGECIAQLERELNFTLNREACMLPPTRLFQVRRILPTKMTKPRSKPRKQHDSCFAIVHEAESRGNGVSQFSNTTELVNAQALLVVQSRMDKLLLHTK